MPFLSSSEGGRRETNDSNFSGIIVSIRIIFIPYKKEKFTIIKENLSKEIDVDDSVGRSVPINMNFIETGYLTKDTGTSLYGGTTTDLLHSIYNYKKKDGTSYFIGASGNRLKKYSAGAWIDLDFVIGVTTISIATPGVVSKTAHGLTTNDPFYITTTGALPTGMTAGTTYYVLSTDLTTDTFKFSDTIGGSAINTTGSQSGVHTLNRAFTVDAKFDFEVYENDLYGCNAVETYFKFDGTTFTPYTSAPRGNILEIFEDAMFVAGSISEPLTIYYSNTGDVTTFSGSDILQPLGTDSLTGLESYYGQMIVFKQDTIWKLTFIYDNVTDLYIPKLELQSGNYGACSRDAISWVENDIWFFTGREVRAIGFKDQQTGVLGVNKAVISDSIKETLKTISVSNYSKIATFYNNRKFYLSVPLSINSNDTIFVCHLLYGNVWTKYNSRIKANALDFVVIDNIIYTAKSIAPYGVLKWDENIYNDNSTAINCEVFFDKIEDKDFNKFNIYRYLDLMFKNLQGRILVTIKEDANDLRTDKTKTFYIGQGLEDELGSIGETDVGEVLVADSFGQTVSSAPFLKNRISFLSKAQTLTVGLSNTNVDETFTICEYALMGYKQPRKMFKPSGIVSVG